MEISEITLNGNTHKLSLASSNRPENKFTLILGENGSGKTEILKRIILSLLRANLKESVKSKYTDRLDNILHSKYKNQIENDEYKSEIKFSYERDTYEIGSLRSNSPRKIETFDGSTITVSDGTFRHSDSINKNGKSVQSIPNNNIIAITESPYSKLPFLAFDGSSSYYNIRAKNEKDENRFSYSEDSKVDEKRSVLAKSIFLSQSSNVNFNLLLKDLSIGNKVKFNFSRVDAYKNVHENNDETEKPLTNGDKRAKTKKDAIAWLSSLPSMDDNSANKFHNRNQEFEYELKVNQESMEDTFISILLENNLIYPTSIEFEHKHEWKNSNAMSSGQLCFLNIFFGISSRIENNSIIIIDEPEVSLHPAWQSKFIVLLHKTFSSIKFCHFIMATHSPHIVSSLVENSYVVTIDASQRTSSTHDWKNYTLRSIDFQLSEFFDYPGFKNEYINRELMQFLIDVSERKDFSTSQLDRVKKIILHKDKMDPADPLLGLITMSESVIMDVQNATI